MNNHEDKLLPKALLDMCENKDCTTPKEYLTPKMLAEDPICPFSEKALRFHIWRSGINGLAPAIYRVGKKILIKRSEWIRWLESHAQKKRTGSQGELK